MARLNTVTRKPPVVTHEGGPAVAGLKPIEQLARSVMSCFLWEAEFYENGVSISERIRSLAETCDPDDVAALAIKARSEGNLRHVPLLLLEVLTRTGAGRPRFVAGVIADVIQRADEVTEFLALYHKMGANTESAQVKKGLAAAIAKFDAYQLSKYDRDGKFRLRDAAFIAHAKPGPKQLAGERSNVTVLTDFASKSRSGLKRNVQRHEGNLIGRMIAGDLPPPETWEVLISAAGKDTARRTEVWEQLCRKAISGEPGGFGYLGLIRNLRNMDGDGVDRDLIKTAIRARKGARRVLPFRYLAAVEASPGFADALGDAMLASLQDLPSLGGKTIVMVDTSGSMGQPVSAKSMIRRVDTAAVLASMVRGDVRLFQFASRPAELAFYQGLPGVQHLRSKIGSVGHGTDIGGAVAAANAQPHDRLIVITDEQSWSPVPAPKAKHAYMLNVASAKCGVGYRNGWVHIDGFSESVLKYIHAYEAETATEAA